MMTKIANYHCFNPKFINLFELSCKECKRRAGNGLFSERCLFRLLIYEFCDILIKGNQVTTLLPGKSFHVFKNGNVNSAAERNWSVD